MKIDRITAGGEVVLLIPEDGASGERLFADMARVMAGRHEVGVHVVGPPRHARRPRGEVFRLTPAHVRLFRAQRTDMHEGAFGAAGVDTKRPYGNSDVYGDIAKLLGVQPKGHDGDEPCFTAEQIEAMERLHAEMELVLQVVISTGQMAPGVYRNDGRPCGQPRWVPVADDEVAP